MKKIDDYIKNLYTTNEYLVKNPSVHEKDSLWKVTKIIPLFDKLADHLNKKEINLLDVGGGSGIILSTISTYIEESHGIKVNKFSLDLSPGILQLQKTRNLDLKKALNEDIRKTSLNNKEIDITLMIDVLEHITNPTEALEEIKRISKFVLFKVPLEDNIIFRTFNFISKNKLRKYKIETVGHINIYSFRKLKQQIETNTGQVLDFYFTNVFKYYRDSKYYNSLNNKIGIKNKLINFSFVYKLINTIALYMFKLSPKLCSMVFNDFVMILVKCY